MAVCLPLIGSFRSQAAVLLVTNLNWLNILGKAMIAWYLWVGGKLQVKSIWKYIKESQKINDNLRLFDMDFYDVFV